MFVCLIISNKLDLYEATCCNIKRQVLPGERMTHQPPKPWPGDEWRPALDAIKRFFLHPVRKNKLECFSDAVLLSIV